MTEPLRIHHLAQNCAVPIGDDKPYDIAIYLNREVDRFERMLLEQYWAELTDEHCTKLHLGAKIFVVAQTSRVHYRTHYAPRLKMVLEKVNAAGA